MRGPLAVTVVLLLTLPACTVATIGPTPERFPPAVSGRGVTAVLQTATGRLQGELLEVRDDGLMVLHGREIVVVLFRTIRRGEFEQMPVRIGGGREPSARSRERLRLVRRFPHGLAPEAKERLLSFHGQTELRLVR
jgi:hypothetical protein